MSLEDYINGKRFPVPAWAELYYNIDSLPIENERLQLLKSLKDYINVFDEYGDNKYVKCDKRYPVLIPHTFYQIKTTTDDTMVIKVPIIGQDSNENYYKISESLFNQRSNTYQKVGEQNFREVFLNFPYTEIVSIKPLYSSDGYIYLSKKDAININLVDIDQLGAELAREVQFQRKLK